MGYIKANEVLPPELIQRIQQYVDGRTLYIPKKSARRSGWGSLSGARRALARRNARIWADYQAGSSVRALTEKYFLSEKSIQRIIRAERLSGALPKEGRL